MNGPKRQGIVSWLSNWIALAMVLGNPVSRMISASKVTPGNRFNQFLSTMMADYTGYVPNILPYDPEGMPRGSWDAKRMIRGYAPIAGAYAFKKGMSFATRNLRVSLIPRLM